MATDHPHLTATDPVTEIPGIGPATAERMPKKTIGAVIEAGHSLATRSSPHYEDAARDAVLQADLSEATLPRTDTLMRQFAASGKRFFRDADGNTVFADDGAVCALNVHKTVAVGRSFPNLATPTAVEEKHRDRDADLDADRDPFTEFHAVTPDHIVGFDHPDHGALLVVSTEPRAEITPETIIEGPSTGTDAVIEKEVAASIATLFDVDLTAILDHIEIGQDAPVVIGDPDSDARALIAPHTVGDRASVFDRQMGMAAGLLADCRNAVKQGELSS